MREWLEPMVEDNCSWPFLIAVNKLLVTLLLLLFFMTLVPWSPHRVLPPLLETSLFPWPMYPSLLEGCLLIFPTTSVSAPWAVSDLKLLHLWNRHPVLWTLPIFWGHLSNYAQYINFSTFNRFMEQFFPSCSLSAFSCFDLFSTHLRFHTRLLSLKD